MKDVTQLYTKGVSKAPEVATLVIAVIGVLLWLQS